MRRRDFMKALGAAAGALVLPPALLLPERKKFFLPPAGGWPRFCRHGFLIERPNDDCVDMADLVVDDVLATAAAIRLYVVSQYDACTKQTEEFVQVNPTAYRKLERWCTQMGIPMTLELPGRPLPLPVRMDEYQCL
jgi:hypothetical protein